jgi:dipeptidyl aminopeptidase/acylaminoacyl peptidase
LSRARSVRAALAGLAALALACRGDVSPFSAADRPGRAEQAALRLTFSRLDDRTPTWSPNGDSVYYAAVGFEGFSAEASVLVAVPRLGGAARPITRNVQIPGGLERRLVAAAVAPDGARFAYAEVGPPWPDPCPNTVISCQPALGDPSLPPLRQVTLRVRRFDATGAVELDPALTVDLPGVLFDDDPFALPREHVVRYYPFHQLYARERASIFRPSWSPDGERLVYSDGLQLYVWEVGAPSGSPIPNTTDGVTPAWSPDGEWIAYTRLERADSSNAFCVYVPPVPPPGLGYTCSQERTDYVMGRRILTVIRPDGGEARELGDGEEPAWSPDGRTLFFRREDRIWRMAIDGSGAESLPFTDGGREPAVSPDGRRLAFARRSQAGDYDIWVLTFEFLR